MNGKLFEDMLIERLERIDGYKHSSTKQDEHQGADFYYYGIPVDITLRDKKSLSTSIGYITLFEGNNINLSIRWGNSRHQFETPVVVMHFTNVINLNSVQTIVSYMTQDVLDDISDAYWSALDLRA